MAKQLNVNLAFTANTSQAKSQIQSLQQMLEQLSTGTNIKGATQLSDDLIQAKNAASQLKTVLEQATNVNTGNLDLSKFSKSLSSGAKDLTYYRQQLEKLGPTGVQAFGQLAQSIMQAEIPIKQTQSLLDEFATTLKNTARWQIASSAIHGVQSAIQSAYSYAQGLNKSLNDIRIVSGLSAEEMDKFADRANQAAQALSTTTKKYADAALIFYQQGLSDSEVEERTNATIKMANVTGEAVDDVSSYMTAVWNNFNKDGTQAAEHFGDVMTKLGAGTAASTEEIAGGLEKFAAVADTIGLSFEYATSAITTIVDRTRQSEDVVGTALKTIFSRIQGLQQGDTLDDGTDLNKYSKGLAKVGVQIKDTEGNLRDMDDILNDIGSTWSTLADDQKVALAQVVAGVRQYSQFMALFDNWDFMKQNLETAYNADGTLEEQAEIYAESWEAARKRVRAAAEDIYNDLLDDDFFIQLNNSLADLLSGLDAFIERIGGLKSVLPLVATLMFKVFGSQISASVDELVYRIQLADGTLKKQALELQQKAVEEANIIANNPQADLTDQQMAEDMATRVQLQQKIAEISDIIGASKSKELASEVEVLKVLQDQTIELQKQVDLSKINAEDASLNLMGHAYDSHTFNTTTEEDRMVRMASSNIEDRIKNSQKAKEEIMAAVKAYRDSGNQNNQELNQALIDIGDRYGSNTLGDSVYNRLRASGKRNRSAAFQADFFEAQSGLIDRSARSAVINETMQYANNEGIDWNERQIGQVYDAIVAKLQQQRNLQENVNQAADKQKQIEEHILETLEQANNSLGTTGQTIMQLSTALSSIIFGISSLISMFQTLASEDATLGEKFMTFLTVAPIALPQVITGISTLASTLKIAATGALTYNAAIKAGQTIEESNLVIRGLSKVALLGENAAKIVGINLTVAQTAANAGLLASMTPLLIGLGVVAAGISALVGIVVLVKKAFDAWEATTPEGKLQAAQESAEELNSTLEETKSVANDIQNTFENFNSIVERIDACTAGTKEWQEALNEANSSALEILEKYPEIASMIDSTKDLVEQLSQDNIQDYLQAKANQQVYQAQQASLIGNINERQAELDKMRSELPASVLVTGDDLEPTADEKKQFAAYLAKVEQYETQTKAEISALASFRVTGLDEYDYAEQVKAILQETYTIGENYKKTLKEVQANQEESAKDYLNLLGIEESKLKSTDDNGLTYDDGSDEGQTIKWETVASTLTSADEDIGEAVKAIVDVFEDLRQESGDIIIKALGSLDSTVSDLNYQELELLNDESDEANDLRQAYREAYEKLYGKDGTASLKQLQENAKKWIKDVYGSFDELTQKSQEIAHELSVSQAKKVGDLFDSKNYVSDQNDTMSYLGSIGELEKQALNEMPNLSEVTNLDDFKEQLREAATEAGQDFLTSAAETYDFESDELAGYAEYIQEIADESTEFADNLADNQKVANDYAVALYRMNKGVETLSKNSENWIDILKKSSKESEEYYSALQGLREALSDVLDITDTTAISADFFDAKKNAQNLELLEKAAKGDEKAIEALRDAAYEDILVNITTNLEDPELTEELQTGFNTLKEKLDAWDFSKDCTIDVNEEEFIASLNKMIIAAGLTEAQIDSIMDAMKYSATYVSADQPTTQTYTGTRTRHEIVQGEYGSSDGWTEETYTEPTEKTIINDVVTTWGFNMNKKGDNTRPQIQTISEKPNGLTNNDSSKNKGGTTGSSGGSKSKTDKVDRKTKRYHRVDDELDDTARKIEKISSLEDRLYGTNKIAQMNKRIKAYEKENKQLEQRNKLAQKYFEQDKKTANKRISSFNKLTGSKISSVKLDKDGDIINYNEILAAAKKRADNWVKKLNKDPDDEKLQKKVEKIKEAYEKLAEGLTQLESTRDEIVETEEKIAENLRNQQDTYFDKLSYKVEVKLDINERDLKILETKLDLIADNVFKRAEALSLLYDKNNSQNEISKTTQQLKIYQNEYSSLRKAYEQGKISQANFVEGLKEVSDGALDSAKSLKDLDDQMLAYYGETLDMVQEQLDKYTDRIDNVSSSLEHYLKIMDLLGKNKEYDEINAINEALSKTAKSNYEVATRSYEMYEAQQKTAKKALDDYVASYKGSYQDLIANDKTYEMLLKNYDEITEKVQESYDQQLSSAEDYLTTLNTLYENAIDQLKEKLEDAFTNGLGYDSLEDSLKNIQTNWDEYLTPVNQAYELTKLQRKATQDLEKTNNAAAKQQYKEYQNYVKQLSEKNQLSNLELEIAQAKYKQLQAQIALEEAQNAKSVVRLSRDSEGNYGYVYTANSDAIADAQQDLDDANNDLYNIALKARNNYGQKIIQTEKEMQEKLAQIDKEYAGDKEKREVEKARIVKEYGEIMETYSKLFRIAGETDSRAVDDAWVHAYDNIINKGSDWKKATDEQIAGSNAAWQDYSTKTSAVYEKLGLDADHYKDKISNLVTEQENLKEEATKKVIPALESMSKSVLDAATAYAQLRQEITNTISEMIRLAENSNNDIKNQASHGLTGESDKYNSWVRQLAEQKEYYTGYDNQGILHYSKNEDTLKKYIENANKNPNSTGTKNWNNNTAENMMNKHGYYIYDSNGKLHYSTAKTKDKAKKFFDSLGVKYTEKNIKTFASGGYTGEWGNSGKLAMLHQKELVLNAEDTKNFLTGIEVLRDVVQRIDLQAIYAGSSNISAANVGSSKSTLAQEVKIHAEFPNAVNHNEIEQAFDTLINRAAQYANRK